MTKQPLKILMMLHMPWDRNLGGSRVQLELAEEFIKLGHEVEKFDYCDAFPQSHSSKLAELTRPSFAIKAKAFVSQNACRFDIIDAHQFNLPFSKQELGFRGLLVARSVGLIPLVQNFFELEKTKWSSANKINSIKNILLSWPRRRDDKYFLPSLQASDLINVCNSDEMDYVCDVMGLGYKCVCFPFGLSQQRLEAFAQTACTAAMRLLRQEVVFIGTWSSRKGAKNWAEIIKNIRTEVPEAKFLFLGTGISADKVLIDLNLPACDWITIVPHYNSEDLPGLLSRATVGAFPSYMEGFGFAVLEKLACGLATVAYDIPGPREMLRHLDSVPLMVPAGDITQFSGQVVKLLKLDENNYSQLSQRCFEIAKTFSWSKIARETLDTYSHFLEKKCF